MATSKRITEFNPPQFNAKGLGRPRAFKTPKSLWNKFEAYQIWAVNNPLQSYEVVKGGPLAGTLYAVPKMRATTWEGFECHCGVDLKNYRESKKGDNFESFIPIIARIGKEIFNHNYSGAAAEMLNPNLVARKLGLVDKKEITDKSTVQAMIYIPDDGRGKELDGQAA